MKRSARPAAKLKGKTATVALDEGAFPKPVPADPSPVSHLPSPGAEPSAVVAESFTPYQSEVFWTDTPRRQCWLWGRRARKSTTGGAKAFRLMAETRGVDVFFLSASLLLGEEYIRKEAFVFQLLLKKMRQQAEQRGMKFESAADGVDIDGLCDLFEHNKLVTRLWHDRTTCSRTLVLAPTPRAVGYGGHVFVDEWARIENLKEVKESIDPIMSDNPQFQYIWSSTSPLDDTHYSWEMFCPPQEKFPVSAKGNWYLSPSKIWVHRVDAWDRQAAGLKVYHPDTGAVITPDEDRKLAFDKDAWDRNFALQFKRSGSAAVSLAAVQEAMRLGRDECLCNAVTEEIVP
jgi:hypothetical protein